MTIAREQITGVVLAGGRGSRMGGVDKGLQIVQGMPLAMHAVLRLRPQVGELMITANRNLGAYEALGVPVWPDRLPGFQGPLAGFLAGLERCRTPYMATVPCDTPRFPEDLVARLAHALRQDDAEIAMAAVHEQGRTRAQPVFCVMKAELMDSLARFIDDGERKVDRWTARHRCVQVLFDDAQAFHNVNTPADLQHLQADTPR
jgi:molybdopterin-guanine dinucleotide biosynthesis protein A